MTNAKQRTANLQRRIDFANFLSQLKTGPIVSLSEKDSLPWFQEGVICEISETMYMYHLEVLPPRWFDGYSYAFGDGYGPFRLYWNESGKYFGRQLSSEESLNFFRLSGTTLIE